MSSSLEERVQVYVVSLFNQNDVESLHVIEKRIQCYNMGSVLVEVNTIKIMIERAENEKVLALYGRGKYKLSHDYKNSYTPIWYHWSPERREHDINDLSAATFITNVCTACESWTEAWSSTKNTTTR